MGDRQYKASLSKGRSGWCVIFYHPLRQAADGQQQLRVRRGLGTRDEAEESALVAQLNEILSDRDYWNPSAMDRAKERYDGRAVAAFYDALKPVLRDPWRDRDSRIPLPGVDEQYATVLFIGTTGAGKTTIVRQLLGTDPEIERFPSISAAKTTTCDLEMVLRDGPFEAVVTFLGKDQARQYVEECVTAAVVSCLEKAPRREVARRFLEHADLKFRLSYLLGTLPSPTEDEDDESDDTSEAPVADAEVGADERDRLAERLEGYLERVYELACITSERVADQDTVKDRDAFEDLEQELPKAQEFQDLVDQILDDVESRFDLLTEGESDAGREGWPSIWSFTSTDRAMFIRAVNRFSSNYAPNFGRLLTPLVQGIRVAGPFQPQWWTGEVPRLVLLDGQGIGHTADSTSSISTGITKRYEVADAILLVDSAAQPMQAAPCAVLRSLVASGHEGKLTVCFTHFDEVKGDNLASVGERKDHVRGSLGNAIHAVGKALGRDAEQALGRLVADERVFFFSNIQKPLSAGNRLTRNEFGRLLDRVSQSIVPPGPTEYRPQYDVANLILAVQQATKEFHERWMGILGLGWRANAPIEHWTRIKALTRRVGVFGRDEYDTLMPVADLIHAMQGHISQFLSSPLRWSPTEPGQADEDKRQQVLDSIRKEAFQRLHALSARRLIHDPLDDWIFSYRLSGPGSTRVRARNLATLYQSAAPTPNEMAVPDVNQFLFEIRGLVGDAIKVGGGDVLGWSEHPG